VAHNGRRNRMDSTLLHSELYPCNNNSTNRAGFLKRYWCDIVM